MPQCIRCERETSHNKEMLEIKTLHIRDFSGERRIQGLGETVTGAVCDSCVREYMKKLTNPGKSLALRIFAFLALALAGILWFFMLSELPLRIPGLCAVLLGIIGAVNAWTTSGKKRLQIMNMPPEQAFEYLGTELLCSYLPKKDKDGYTDIAYIEMTPTLAEGIPGDLAVRYALLPVIAKQISERAAQRFTGQ